LFVNVAFPVDPSPCKEKELLNDMHSFADSLRKHPGLQRIQVLKEKDGKTLVGISMWDDEASFNEAMKKIASQPANSGKAETLRPNPPVVRQFYEI
jgi:heme-degrading monooxygenase HmoA